MSSGFHGAAGEDSKGMMPSRLVITEADNGGSKLL